MRLTTEFRGAPARLLSAAKDYNLCCHVQFSNEERAIIEERGLHALSIELPPDLRPLSAPREFGIGLIHPVARLMIVGGLLYGMFVEGLAHVNTNFGAPILFIGIGLELFGWFKRYETNKKLSTDTQTITLGGLLSNPDFVVHSDSPDGARFREAETRENLAQLSSRIKAAAELPAQATYEL